MSDRTRKTILSAMRIGWTKNYIRKKGAIMKLVWMSVLGVVLLVCQVYAGEQVPLKDQKDKISYIIGLEVGNNLKNRSIEIDPDLFIKGMKDAFAGNKPLMSEEEMNKTKTDFAQEMQKKHEEEMKKSAEKNKKEEEAFFEENKKKEGVITLPSGLQYKVVTEGKGKTPKLTDTVTVNYRGTLINGTEFDSSYKRGQPATFPVKGVIPGWTEALQLMKEGSKWQLFIPSKLGYGEKGAGSVIGPDAALIFDVELISVKESSDQGHDHGHE
jgi:FKBP-type peptidyl-prolyl cis-trans isomerase FklB